MMELPVTVMGDSMHTMETAKNTEMGLMSSVSILVTVGMSVVASSPPTVVGSASVASADIVAPATSGRSALFSPTPRPSLGQVPLIDASSSVRRHDAKFSRLPRRVGITLDRLVTRV